MDISTLLVDLLRGDENFKLDPKSAESYRTRQPSIELLRAGQELRDPDYIAYRREAIANGERPMSFAEFQAAKSKDY